MSDLSKRNISKIFCSLQTYIMSFFGTPQSLYESLRHSNVTIPVFVSAYKRNHFHNFLLVHIPTENKLIWLKLFLLKTDYIFQEHQIQYYGWKENSCLHNSASIMHQTFFFLYNCKPVTKKLDPYIIGTIPIFSHQMKSLGNINNF